MAIDVLKKLFPNYTVSTRIWRGPFRGARIVMKPRDSLRKILGIYEHELNSWIEQALRRVSREVYVGANDGYFTFGCALVIPFIEPNKGNSGQQRYGRRNDILFAWHNVPMPYLPFHLVATLFNGIKTAIKSGRIYFSFLGAVSGFAQFFSRWNERAPVPAKIYRLQRWLRKNGPHLLDEVARDLPPLTPDPVTPTATLTSANQ